MRLFISYSHKDAAVLERLHVHLAGMRRERLISEWYDREILAGDDIDNQISEQLESADIFLLLVSPDFIASDYCVERELARALERHDQGNARVIPIIVEPCDWASMDRLRRLKALPRDGAPISEFANENTAFVDITQELRRILDSTHPQQVNATSNAMHEPGLASPKYRVKRDFDEIDRANYRDEAFLHTKSYIEAAIRELDQVQGLRARFNDGGPTSFGCTVINQNQAHGTAHITVHRAGGGTMLGDIFWLFEQNAPPNSANGWVNVKADEYELFLDGIGAFHDPELKKLSPQAFSEYLWNQLLEQAGITHA